MNVSANFNPGPSQLYFTVEDHMRKAFRDDIPSLSHRSRAFETIYHQASEALRELLGIPEQFTILFLASATEAWERVLQNLVAERSYHFVNGAFSKRFYEIALQLNKKPEQAVADAGDGFFSVDRIPVAELFAITHNETSTGVSLPMEFISRLRTKHQVPIIAVDAVSSIPYPTFDFNTLDTLFFSVQKGFGLPAGLGVWIVNENCIEKAKKLMRKNISTGSYHNLNSLVSHAKKNQTPETPNVLGIYLLAKVVQDMLRRGMTTIRRETEYKAAILYQALEQHSSLSPFVTQREFRSNTVIVADCGVHTGALLKFLNSQGIQPGEGYGSFKNQHLRFANFPAHSKEQVELLVDTISAFKP